MIGSSSIRASNWVVTKTTVPETDKMFWLVPDGQAQFFKLWGVS